MNREPRDGWYALRRSLVTPRFLGVLLVALLLSLPAVAGAKRPRYLEVVKPEVNLRAGPGTRYDKVGTAQQGDLLRILSRQKPWYEVEMPTGEVAWVYARLVKRATIHLESGHRITPSGNYANLRKEPSKRAHRVGRIERDEELPVLRERGDWYEVDRGENKRAWVHHSVVHLLAPDLSAPLLEQLKASYPGIVRWGAVNEVVLKHYREAELDLVVESSWHFLPEEQRLELLSEAAAAFQTLLKEHEQYHRRYHNLPLVVVTDPSNTVVGSATPKQARLLP